MQCKTWTRAAVVQLNVFTTAADLHNLINDNVRPLQDRAFLEQQSFKNRQWMKRQQHFNIYWKLDNSTQQAATEPISHLLGRSWLEVENFGVIVRFRRLQRQRPPGNVRSILWENVWLFLAKWDEEGWNETLSFREGQWEGINSIHLCDMTSCPRTMLLSLIQYRLCLSEAISIGEGNGSTCEAVKRMHRTMLQ
jgi:hypothetical protein